MTRHCAECQLCCRLLPVRELKKAANQRCQHQQSLKGCSIYTRRPLACALWNCRWLINDDTYDLSRPDRSHYVIDTMPDRVVAIQDEIKQVLETVQIWVDPKYPDAWREPKLMAYLERRSKERVIGQIRYNSEDCILVIPPSMSGDGTWIEKNGEMKTKEELNAAVEEADYFGGVMRQIEEEFGNGNI